MSATKQRYCEYLGKKKIRYVDELDARCAYLMAQLKPHLFIQAYYYHKFCRGWHLTSKEQL